MSGALLVDLLLALVLVAYAVSGIRQGFLHGVAALTGFVLGGFTGIAVLPPLADRLAAQGGAGGPLQPGVVRVVGLLAGVLVLAWVGQLLGGIVGTWLRDAVTWRPARLVDRALGAVTSVLVVVLLTWVVAGALRTSPAPTLAQAIGESRVVRVVDAVVPSGMQSVVRRLGSMLEAGGFPRVFEGLGPETILPVDPPDPAEVGVAATAAAGGIVKVTGLAVECRRGQEGTGFVVAPERVVTNAHVVAGMPEPVVRLGGQGERYEARVVLFDPQRDLAVLAVPDLDADVLPLGEDLSRGDPAVVAGFPLDGPYRSEPARVRQVLTARGEDVYGEPGVDRRVYSLFTRVQSGNSGGPLLDEAGRVVGVVFAKSLDDPDTGYALTLEESMPVLEQASLAVDPVDVGPCAAS